jgi:putative endonuclease
MYYVYLLESKNSKSDFIYTGYTSDLERRLESHNDRQVQSTKHEVPFELVYYKACKSKSGAKEREKQLKRHTQAYTALKERAQNSFTSSKIDSG